MTIKHPGAVADYEQKVVQIRNMLANLAEFCESLPAVDNDVIPHLHYGHMGSIQEIHTLLTRASEFADAFCGT